MNHGEPFHYFLIDWPRLNFGNKFHERLMPKLSYNQVAFRRRNLGLEPFLEEQRRKLFTFDDVLIWVRPFKKYYFSSNEIKLGFNPLNQINSSNFFFQIRFILIPPVEIEIFVFTVFNKDISVYLQTDRKIVFKSRNGTILHQPQNFDFSEYNIFSHLKISFSLLRENEKTTLIISTQLNYREEEFSSIDSNFFITLRSHVTE